MPPDDRILSLLLRYEELRGQGQVVSPEELCRECPEQVEEIRRRIRALKALDTLLADEHKAWPVVPGYKIFGVSGQGGMGVVYRARHKTLDREVAIKVTLPGAPTDRFLREAKLLAKIKSPYVVIVHDFQILASGHPMLVMEWVEGTNLQQLIEARRGPLPESEVIPWMRHTCEGMLAAAEQGITHRDLKPSNLLIDTQGRARVADFGIARGPAPAGDFSHSNQVMGTPHYMAPEQAEDPRIVDTRSDIYSFGATFYHALTGRPPFQGETVFSVLYKHKTEPLIAPRALAPGISERTGELLERCLAKSPADRFSSFGELLGHLQQASKSVSPWAVSADTALALYLERYQSRQATYLDPGQKWHEELDVYTFPRGQVLRIQRGDLTHQRVDALVSSCDRHMTMAGGVAAAIRAAGGPEIEEAVSRVGPVRPGRAFVTSAGALPARFVFHGVTIGYFGGELVRPSRDLIIDVMTSCFYHADSHDVHTIAFPLLGTGAAGFSKEVCLNTMFQFLARTFLYGLTCVREARIVLFG